MRTFKFNRIIIIMIIILVMLIPGCKPKSEAGEITGKPDSSGLLYTNTKYGFTLEFPATWKDYLSREALVSYDNDVKAPVVYFGLPAQADIFAIGIYTQDQWEKLTKMEGPDGKAGITPMAKNNAYLFDYSVGHYAANEEMQARRVEVSSIIDTLKVTDI